MTPQAIALKHAEAYVGTPYELGRFDCADLAVLVQREVFGRAVALPTNRPRPGGVRGQAREVLGLRDAAASRVERPETGHAVLFTEPADNGGELWHVGTLFLQGADVWVLHNSRKLGSACLHRLETLQRSGLHLDGFYAWREAAHD